MFGTLIHGNMFYEGGLTMNKLRKKIYAILIFSMLLTLLSVPSFAGNREYSFELRNTGRTFVRDPYSPNTKINTSSGWVYRVEYIYFTDSVHLSSTLGMAFSPLTGNGYNVAGHTSWTKTTGRKTGTYLSGYGGTGLYYLGARMDDLLTGTATSRGLWNSDSW